MFNLKTSLKLTTILIGMFTLPSAYANTIFSVGCTYIPNLSNNGAGPLGTKTHRLGTTSNALSGSVGGCVLSSSFSPLDYDQRFTLRSTNGSCDVGSFEL